MAEGQAKYRPISEVDIPVLMPESKGRKRTPTNWWRLIVLVLVVGAIIAWRVLRSGR
jgi:hypothetical protein